MDYNNTPTWIIQDPINNQFYHIGWLEYQLLSHWKPVSQDAFIARFNEISLAKIDKEGLEKFILFLSKNCLVTQGYEAIEMLYQEQQKGTAKYSLQWFLKRYLFVRIPLIKPDHFLSKTFPYIKKLFTAKAAIIMNIFAVIALIFIIRQWDTFTSTFFDLFSLKYLIIFFIAISISKVCHELGHAYTCKKYGLIVPAMGIAFLVLIPMLYTDASESWKIRKPKYRLYISLAGVIAEYYLAIIALWLWIFLTPGMLKSICFFLATYSLLATLLINISPFLRFDGYFVLSDLLHMRNLQTRSFAMTRWWLRKKVLGIKDTPPENFNRSKRFWLTLYALCTWLYRFILFIGIAFLVYHFFFKVLGILLFIVEIYYFILHPIFNELKVWWEKRHQIKKIRHILMSSTVAIITLIILFFPWQNSIYIPATFTFQNNRYYLDRASQVESVSVQKGEHVLKGQTLLTFKSPLLDTQIQQIKTKIKQTNWKLRNIGTANIKASQRIVLQRELTQYQSKLDSLREKQVKLNIKAPFDGEITTLRDGLSTNAWVAKNQAILIVTNRKQYFLYGYASTNEKSMLTTGKLGRFIPDDPSLPAVKIKLMNIDYQQVDNINLKPDLSNNQLLLSDVPAVGYHISATAGTDIPVRRKDSGDYVPQSSIYEASFAIQESIPTNYGYTIPGEIVIKSPRESIATLIGKHIIVFLIREISF